MRLQLNDVELLAQVSPTWTYKRLQDSENEKTVEHRLIDKIRAWTGERLIGDDCAILPGVGLVTADTLVEDTHFSLPGITYNDLGWKAMAVNLSDVAAMAGRPRYAVISIALPEKVHTRDFETLYQGLVECARAYRTRIVGGDLTRGQQLVLSLTVIGDEHENGVMTRSRARAGDVVVVSGDFGASAAGLWLMQNGDKRFPHCSQKHFRPLPRICEAWALVRQTAGQGAMMDASDGLADALIQMAAASNVGLTVDATKIPIHQQTRDVAQLAGVPDIDWALYGGEDYELVACISLDAWQALEQSPSCPFNSIGKVVEPNSGVALIEASGNAVPITLTRSFQHWTQQIC